MTRTLPALAFLLTLALAAPAHAQKIAVTGGKTDQANVVVYAPLPAGAALAPNAVTLPDGLHAAAQITHDGKTLAFVLPKLKAGETVTVTPTTLTYVKAPPQFKFADEKDGTNTLSFDGRKVLNYFNLAHDPKDHFFTFKPFHNVYDPAKGEVMLSNSSAKTTKDGQFPHHRGLFFGFNRIGYDGKTADIWHGTDNVFSQHDKALATEAGEVFGRQRSAISWHGKDAATFATEERDVTAFNVPGGTLIDWNTALATKLDKVRLDGDPQHAGFHFRANQEVSKNGKTNTYYLRPDGKGKVGETRNWDAKGKNASAVNLPWNAMSFVVAEKRYTVLRIAHPSNPKETRGSERDYGRFGDYFEYDLTPKSPLALKYRVWVQEGEMSVEQCNALAGAFVTPPATKVVK